MGFEIFDEQDKDGNTPLHIATKKNHLLISKFLLEMGANVNKVNNNGETALMNACRNGNLNLV